MNNNTNQASQFYQLALKDASLQEKFKGITDENSIFSLAVQLGKENGFNFTSEELKSTISQEENLDEVELRDELLQAVSGGKGGLSFAS